MTRQQPTARQLQVLRAVVRLGSTKAAAHELGLREVYVRQILSRCYEALGVDNVAQAAFWLGSSTKTEQT